MSNAKPFPLREAKELVKDLFDADPWIYWPDFLFYNTLGWACFILCLTAPALSWQQGLFYVVASLALYRAVIFIHELTHLKKDSFKLFRVLWNLTCGFPLMVPSFLYMGVHIDHHKQKVYGTKEDGEYFDFVPRGPMSIVLFVLFLFTSPAVFLARFILVPPLTWIFPPFRRFIWERGSSLVIDASYKRAAPEPREGRIAFGQEALTFLYAATAIWLMARGTWPWKVLVLWYAVSLFILFTNGIRTLVAHCYRNPDDHVLEFAEQFQDSVNIPGNPLISPLWAPVGLRFHATHHLFPGMPYHNLGKAHRRLLEGLPEGSGYRNTLRKNLLDGLARIWNESRRSRKTKAH